MMNADLEQILIDKAVLMGNPLRATLELTPVCNLNCEMCYIRHSREEAEEKGGILRFDFWENTISELQKLEVLIVTLIGGEPFLHPDIEKIYLALATSGFLINITTNGTLLAHHIPWWLKEYPPRYITVSLYGASEETYAKVTGNPSGYHLAIQGIENLQAAGIPVKLNYMVTPQNKEDLEKMYELKEKYQAPLLVSSYSLPATRKVDGTSQNRLTPEECANYCMRNKYLSQPAEYADFCKRVASGKIRSNEGLHANCITCYAGKGMIWITWQGKLQPCSMMTNISYSLKEESLCVSWIKLRENASNINTSSKCADCSNREICLVCAGSMFTETGSYDSSPDYLCKVTERIVEIANEYCRRPRDTNDKYDKRQAFKTGGKI